MHGDSHTSNDEQGPSAQPSLSTQVITPTRSKSRGTLAGSPGWPTFFAPTRAPGSECNDSRPQPDNLARKTSSGTVQLQHSSHLPTPQSPRYAPSYLLAGTPAAHNLEPDLESNTLPTEFRSHASSPPPHRPHSIPTPESSPLVARTRSNVQSFARIAHSSYHDDNDPAILSRSLRDTLRSRMSTPPRTPSPQTSTRPVTPSQERPISSKPTQFNDSPDDSTPSPPFQKVKKEPGGEAAHIHAHLTENHLASTQAAESRRPDYFKRTRRLAPSSNGGEVSLASDSVGKEGSLLWSSANVGVIDTPIKGKRIALFQETSEESFEESLMAGGYGRYRSDRPLWKLDESAEAPNQLGDAMGEAGLSSGLMLTEDEKRKKTRLAAFLDPPRASSTSQLFPVEIEGCGRVLIKLEPSEPQMPPKPAPNARRSRKRKKASADMKQDVDEDAGAGVPQDRAIGRPNWPDTEFPWRSCLMTRDGLSSAERKKRLQYIESFLDGDTDEDDEDGPLVLNRHSSDEARSRSSRRGRGKIHPLSHYNKRRRGLKPTSVIACDPADAKTALLSKKSVRAVQLRLSRRNTDHAANSEDGETLCICQERDDGRPLVQCDACRTWYHLECIGVESASELGREEDAWFCANCVDIKTPSPFAVPLAEPILVPTDNGEQGGLGEYDPFLNTGLQPSPVTPWTRMVGLPMTPRRLSLGSSWEEAPSSSSHRGPRTPQFNTASAFGDMVRVYSTTPGRTLEPPPSTILDEPSFDPTSTPSRGIRFGLPFTTPKDGRWGSSSTWQGVRGTGYELFHTPNNHPMEEASKHGLPLHPHGKAGENSEEELSGLHSLYRMSGPNNVTPIERNALGGAKRIQVLESPLGSKRSRRTVDS